MLTSLLRVVEAQRPVGGCISIADTLHLWRPCSGEQRIDTATLGRGIHDEVFRLHPTFLALLNHLLRNPVLLEDATSYVWYLQLHGLGSRTAWFSITEPAEIGEHENAIITAEGCVMGRYCFGRKIKRRRGSGLLDYGGGPYLVHHAVGRRKAENVHVPLHAVLPLGDAEGFDVSGVHEAGAHGLPRLHVRTMECVEVDADTLWLDRLPERGILIHIRPALAGHRPLLAIGARPIRGVGEESRPEIRIRSGIVDSREQHLSHVFALVGHDPAPWGMLAPELGGVHVGGVRRHALYQEFIHVRLCLAADLELQLVARGCRLERLVEEALHGTLLHRLHDVTPDTGTKGVELGRGYRRRGLVGLG